MELTAVFMRVPEGGYVAFVEELPGANTQGATLDEATGAMTGSAVVVEFPDRAALDAWLAADPYVTGDVWRYAPEWNAPGGLDEGYWTQITTPGKQSGATGGARAMAIDGLRRAQQWFAWEARGDAVVVIDAAALARPQRDQVIDGSAFPIVSLTGRSLVGISVENSGTGNVMVAMAASSQAAISRARFRAMVVSA